MEWRGEDEDDPNAMEDILREVIVIPDDEEGEDKVVQDEAIAELRRNRHDSVEIIDSHVLIKNMELKPVDYSKQQQSGNRASSSDSDDVQPVTFLGNGQYVIDRKDSAKNARDGARRQLAWRQALSRRTQPGERLQATMALDPGRTLGTGELAGIEPRISFGHSLPNDRRIIRDDVYHQSHPLPQGAVSLSTARVVLLVS